jgi:uncharacterized iron-regulated protein
MLAVLVAQTATPAAPPAAPQAPSVHQATSTIYVPQRVYDTRRKVFTDFETMLADLARADVVLVGEQHDDPNTHRLESAILQGLMRRHVSITLSLEMFERDVQPSLDAYLAGTIAEAEFLGAARPWPRYATDYRSLVEMARGHKWPVIAANVPRRLASDVSKTGKGVLETLASTDRAFVAKDLQCPEDDYFRRFAEQVATHPAGGAAPQKNAPEDRTRTERFYWSQCLKDETMGESIATTFDKQTAPGTIVHVTGSFHTDFGLGTAERVRRRLAGRRVAVLSLIPVADVDGLNPGDDDRKRAEYLVYTVK